MSREVRLSTGRPRPRPLFVTFVILGLIGFALFGIQILDALIFNPWALSLTGGPTLTGRWTGEVRLPDGDTRLIHLVIKHSTSPRCRDCDIDGTARLCRGATLERQYRIAGDNDTWRGAAFHISLTPESDSAEGELRLGRLEGEWTGENIRFTAPWWRHSQTATAEVRRGETTPEEPRLTFALRKGGSSPC